MEERLWQEKIQETNCMRYIYIVMCDVDYKPDSIVAVKSNVNAAIDYAENNDLHGDEIRVIKYEVNWQRQPYDTGETIAKWRKVFG